MKTLVAAVVTAGLVATPAPTPDGLTQSLDPNQREATGRAVLEQGHVDLGPRYRDGKWTIQVHDGTVAPPVWRQPSDVVLRVRDAAVERVPDDPTYAFLGQQPGTPVHVVPQTQNPEVVWLGWNTQDPGVLSGIGRGVTMNLLGVQGPGSVIVYLQSGNLGAPQVLWNSTLPYPQPLWVDTNTHTHANWIFTKPGVYLVAVEITADLAAGGQVSGRSVLRLAVGDGTSVDEAFATQYTAGLPTGAASATPTAVAAADPGGAGSGGGGSGGTLPVVIGVAAVAFAGVVLLVLARGARARRRAADEQLGGSA
ncbi:choice-of-anchor M domain-containing protein [Micromonospora sp. CPCC 206061]|uniref:choice-of-anchor M domain-containing protein n=1 Tax=Micromonospora sp. CPCC 206061 TaxID=3122410 RepID=UPI002FF35E3D